MNHRLKDKAELIETLVSVIYDSTPEGLDLSILRLYQAYYSRTPEPEFKFEAFKNRIICGLAARVYLLLEDTAANITDVAITWEESWT